MKRFLCLEDIKANGLILFKKGNSYLAIPAEDGSEQFIEAESPFLSVSSGKMFVTAEKQHIENYFKEI